MLLCNDFHCEMVLKDLYIGIIPHCLNKAALNFETCVVGMVQNTEFRVSSLTVKVELAILFPVEIHAPVDKFHDLLGCVAHHLLHRATVADIVAGNHGVFDMFVEIIDKHVSH